MKYNVERIIKLSIRFNELSEREKKILARRFLNKQTLEEVGKEFGVSRERVRQIEAKILEKLRIIDQEI